ncbi:hypothetical protein [Bosea sp. (in: a-proteobacteria)]|uniref:hypothetical protein n=1 Tax=Bosea sp. (in: a-proteobacteria) TaxID=1871050 RepID=UPI00261536C2|nr:hypothetical protein [Bosea sp. (in: a-proteobacteria)]MCO5092641.1 hypothetical protein [Bosea sp. (in: a-proteobacteria)]
MSALLPHFRPSARNDADMKKGAQAEAMRAQVKGKINMLNVAFAQPNAKAGNTESLFSETHVSEARRATAWLEDRIAMSTKLGASELHSEVVTISPVTAEVILAKCNTGNRPLRPKRVALWDRTIREGRWKLTSQGISFARDGRLNNGQHRLNGIIAAGRAVQMMATFGEGRDVFDVLDTGGMRSGSDTLHVAGYKNTALLAASARLIAIVTGDAPGGNSSFSNDEIKQIVEQHPLLEDATTAGGRIGKKLKTSAAGMAAAFYLIETKSQNARRLDHFVDRLADGASLKRRDPILVLREGLRGGDIAPASGGGNAGRITAATINAWNLWVRGRSAQLSALRWDTAQPFPQPE